jgi:hypothetical protein
MKRPHTRKHLPLAAAVAGSLALSGCAIGNKAELQLVRNITFGQEMIDLKRAKDEGALTEEEYLELKQRVMEILEIEGVVELVEEISSSSGEDED